MDEQKYSSSFTGFQDVFFVTTCGLAPWGGGMTRTLTIALVDDDRDLSLKPADLEVYKIRTVPESRLASTSPETIDAVVIAASEPEKATELACLKPDF